VRRHEALRTVFRTVGEQLIQVVLPDVPCPLPIVDLTHLPPTDREAEAACRAAVELRRAFDLERGPLLRAGLLRLADEDHVLWLEVHQIACDGWSLGILFQDFAAVYAAFLRGEPSPLPPLPVRYADYAVAQRARMQGEILCHHLTYWKKQLAGLAESLELPTDWPRPVKPAHRGGTRFFLLSTALTEAMESLGRREMSWLFMTLLAGFQALLQRYTGQNDIAVGTPVADRPRRELHKMIGSFLNLVVLRTDLSGDPSFRELLRRVRTMALKAYAHQELPFERLVAELPPAWPPRRQPLFQVMFTLLNDPTMGMALPGLRVTPIAVDCGAALYDLRLIMTRTEAGLAGALEYDSDLFDAGTIDRMIGHFKALLSAAVADPDRPLSDLPLLTDAEPQQQPVAWNDTRAKHPGDPSNGKIDRKALPAPGPGLPEAPKGHATARTPLEEELAAIWAKLLGRERVGVHDNFFDLGGDSLLAMQMIGHVNSRFKSGLEVVDILRSPTIAAMALQLAAPAAKAPIGRTGHLDVLHAGRSGAPVVIIGWREIVSVVQKWVPDDVPLWSLKIDGFQMRPLLIRPISEIGAAFADELLRAAPPGPLTIVSWSFPGLLVFDVTRRLREAGRSVHAVLLEPPIPGTTQQNGALPHAEDTETPMGFIQRHSAGLSRLTVRQRIAYIWEHGLGAACYWFKHWFKRGFARINPRLRVALGAYLPSHLPLLLRFHIRLRVLLSGAIPDNLLWWHYFPQVCERVSSYVPSRCPGTIHLVGTKDWLSTYGAAWQSLVDGEVIPCTVPGASDHFGITQLPAAACWLDLIRQLSSRPCGRGLSALESRPEMRASDTHGCSPVLHS
jgi:hypothetical protein